MNQTCTTTLKAISCCTFLFAVLLTGCCDCDKTPSNKGDTAAAVPAVHASEAAEFRKIEAATGPRSRIPYPDASGAIRLNREKPCLQANDTYVNGFMFAKEDLVAVMALHPDKLFLQIAVSNYKDSTAIRAGKIKPSYTIMVIPVDSNGVQMKDAEGMIAYDFTCPCPANTSCCPQDPGN